jgi:hypothetical protein
MKPLFLKKAICSDDNTKGEFKNSATDFGIILKCLTKCTENIFLFYCE